MTGTPSKPKRGFSLIELLVVLSILAILISFLAPARRTSREASRRSECKNHLKQIGIALHNYAETYGGFPPAYTVDADGNRLHSWRTLILPFMDQKPLYERMDLSKPWNDPANAEAFNAQIPAYLCPSASCPIQHTTYLAVVGEGSSFHPIHPRPLSSFTDGTNETLLVIEVASHQAVHWMSPMEADEDMLLSFSPTTPLPHANGFHGLLADGSVRWFQAETPEATRRALMSIAGNDQIDPEGD
jgi:prepilin-type N-terminal cleavage/methylation domain-containing protein